MADGTATTRVPQGQAAVTTVNRRRVRLFFQQFPGTAASSGIAGLDFTVTIEANPPRNGTTPADGSIEIRLGAGETATVEVLGSTYEVTLLAGGLFPVTELRGVQQRLNMLGYNAGDLESP